MVSEFADLSEDEWHSLIVVARQNQSDGLFSLSKPCYSISAAVLNLNLGAKVYRSQELFAAFLQTVRAKPNFSARQ